MIAVLQRVRAAEVRVGEETVGRIGAGLLVLLGVAADDTAEDAERLAGKVARCRIFRDETGRMNRSAADVGGGVLVVSNFTLLADCRHGNRPAFTDAAPPDRARALYEEFRALLGALLPRVEGGRFGAHMEIGMTADGPVTIVLDSRVWRNRKETAP